MVIKKVAIICMLICFACTSTSQAAGIGIILSELAKQALKLVGSEALKSGVEYFKDLFNKDKNIAKRYRTPELKGGEIKGNERTWIISPAGNLNKSDIKEIARTLKSLDGNREQSIRVTIRKQAQIFNTTQTGVVTQSGNIVGNGNTMIATGHDYVGRDKYDIRGDYVAGDKLVKPPEIQDIVCTRASAVADCPLEIDAYGYELSHPEGSNVDGIVWKEDIYSDLRVTLTNKSLARLHNINFILQPETYVRKAVQATNNPGVTISPDRNLGGIKVQEMAITVVDEKGVSSIIPVSTGAELTAPKIRFRLQNFWVAGR